MTVTKAMYTITIRVQYDYVETDVCSKVQLQHTKNSLQECYWSQQKINIFICCHMYDYNTTAKN